VPAAEQAPGGAALTTNPASPLLSAGWGRPAGTILTKSAPVCGPGGPEVGPEVSEDLGARVAERETTYPDAMTNEKSLARALEVLVSKGMVDSRLPYAAPPGKKDRRYVVVDPYLRFWLRFIGPNIDEIDCGRGDLVVDRIERDWPTFRGKAIEPVIQRSVERLLPDSRFGAARFVGSYWTRTNDPEVDLVGAADRNQPTTVDFVGSIKWRESAPFSRHDTSTLIEERAKVPGAPRARLVGVSRSGFSASDLDVKLTAGDLLEAWPDPYRRPIEQRFREWLSPKLCK
jgi:hypothetical protein